MIGGRVKGFTSRPLLALAALRSALLYGAGP